MSSYLEGYGAGEEKRDRWLKRALIGAALAIVLGIGGYFGLRNFTKRQALDRFVEFLDKKDYRSAYTLWGCTEATPCRDYSFERFMRDWGPGSPGEKLPQAPIVSKATCGGIFSVTGILRAYQVSERETIALWVNADDGNIGFAPSIGRMQCTLLP